MLAFVLASLVACGGEAPAPAPTTDAPAAPAPAAPQAAPAPEAAAPGPYTPSALAQTAYAAAAAAGADKTPNPKAGNAEAIAKGKAVFANKCVSCHGNDGKADGPTALALNPRPANFHDKGRWDHTPVGTKHWILKNGITGSIMMPLGLSDDEAWEVLAYIEAEFVGK
jgi:high-affinity iron transporter